MSALSMRSFGHVRASAPAAAARQRLSPLTASVQCGNASSFATQRYTSHLHQCKHSQCESLSAVHTTQRRHFVGSPTVNAPIRKKKITTVDLQKFKNRDKPITMATAYTYPSAVHVSHAGVDVLLVGDSLAMVELGYDTTLPIEVDEMLYHCKAVARGADTPLLVGDLPFGSYEGSPEQAYKTAVRFLKEGGMDAVKVEGGEVRAKTVQLLSDGGVAVMGHIGLTPQRVSILGGFRAQGKSLDAAKQLIRDAIALEEAGAFALVIECVPAVVAQAITSAVSIPTIGIGAGPHCSGQVLVFHDLLGFFQHAHHAAVSPSFCKKYANVGEVIQQGLDAYVKDVEARQFPGTDGRYSPYKVIGDVDEMQQQLEHEVKMLKSQHQGMPKNSTANLNVQQASGSDNEPSKVY